MAKNKGMFWAVLAISIFVLGGISTFTGLGLIGFMNGRNLLNLGDGRTFGLLLLCVGLCASIMGVLIMRIVRNRVYR
ncbi:hypothetical protein GMSM_38120 [Geomonas sp. Red276]